MMVVVVVAAATSCRRPFDPPLIVDLRRKENSAYGKRVTCKFILQLWYVGIAETVALYRKAHLAWQAEAAGNAFPATSICRETTQATPRRLRGGLLGSYSGDIARFCSLPKQTARYVWTKPKHLALLRPDKRPSVPLPTFAGRGSI